MFIKFTVEGFELGLLITSIDKMLENAVVICERKYELTYGSINGYRTVWLY